MPGSLHVTGTGHGLETGKRLKNILECATIHDRGKIYFDEFIVTAKVEEPNVGESDGCVRWQDWPQHLEDQGR